MYRDRERDDTQLSAHASEITADDHQEPSTTRFSSSGPLPQVDHAAGPVGPMGSTASDRAYDLEPLEVEAGSVGASAEQAAEPPVEEPGWVISARMYNDNHQEQVVQFDQHTNGSCIGADGQLDPNLVADWQLQHDVAADGRVSQETLAASMSWLTAIGSAGSTSASSSGEDDAETMRKLNEAADANTQLLDVINLT